MILVHSQPVVEQGNAFLRPEKIQKSELKWERYRYCPPKHSEPGK